MHYVRYTRHGDRWVGTLVVYGRVITASAPKREACRRKLTRMWKKALASYTPVSSPYDRW